MTSVCGGMLLWQEHDQKIPHEPNDIAMTWRVSAAIKYAMPRTALYGLRGNPKG